jgi:hypothetical protein
LYIYNKINVLSLVAILSTVITNSLQHTYPQLD